MSERGTKATEERHKNVEIDYLVSQQACSINDLLRKVYRRLDPELPSSRSPLMCPCPGARTSLSPGRKLTAQNWSQLK